METIVVRPRTAGELDFFKELFRKVGADVEYAPMSRPETLEGKVFRLYEAGHYTDSELKQFLSIPKDHRIDPFEVIDDGDVYWADKRNVEQTIADVRQAKRDREEGRSIVLRTREELEAYFNAL